VVLFDDDLHDMSLQGPVSVDFLDQHVKGIRDLTYFGIMNTRLFGRDVMISRTGYTGERGYEIFCRAKDAVHLWDNILEGGKDMGIRPVQFSTLDLLRTESYLLFYPGDNSETYPFANEACGDTLWELGLEFTVSPGKIGFIGAENHYSAKGRERFKIYGVVLDGTSPADEGADLLQDGKKVGDVTFGMYSDVNKHNVAIARMPVSCATPGTQLTVRNGDGTEIAATAQEMPFYDQDKSIRTAKG
jgi:aminomethyltransferase